MGKRVLAALAVILIIPVSLSAQKYAGEFMALGGGARAMGMGGAFTAVAGDATTGFWNPAGLVQRGFALSNPDRWEAVLMHSERFGDLIDYNFLSLAHTFGNGKGACSLTFIHMGISDIRVIPYKEGMIGNSDGDEIFEPWNGEYLNFDYTRYPFENVNDFALFFSYAQMLSQGAFGASVKLIRNDQIAGVSSFGVGFDVGYLKKGLWRKLILGAKIQDLTGTYIGWSTGEREFIYPALKLGVAYPLNAKSLNTVFLLSMDGDFRFENRRTVSQFWLGRASADFHLGMEMIVRNIVALRGGMDVDRPTAGVGFILKDFGPWKVNFGLDYALLIHDALDTTHRVSIIVSH